jgi:NitT/TauT family transport system substrate-binding protein
MKSRDLLTACATAIVVLAAGCSSASGDGAPLKLEKTSIVVDAFPAIDSAGLYIAQTDGLFARQGLNVTIVPVQSPAPTTQSLIDGQLKGSYDITAGDYVTYIDNQLGIGRPRTNLRIIAEASFLQPNVLALLVRGGSPVTSIAGLKNKTVSVNAANDIGTLLIDSLLVEHGLSPKQVQFNNDVAFPDVAAQLDSGTISAGFAPEPFVSQDEELSGIQELADLDQGSTQDFPVEGYAVTQAWAQKYPNTLLAFTRALSQAQEIADSNRSAAESAIEKYLNIPATFAASISLPTFPTGLDSVRLQRVVSAMNRFGFLPPQDQSFKITSMTAGS